MPLPLKILSVLVLPLLAAIVPAAAADIAIPVQDADPALHALLPDAVRASGRITLVTDAHALPCEAFDDARQTIVGFEPDVIRAVTQKLGVGVEMTSTDFPGVIPGLQSARYDMAMSCLTDRPDREESMTFIDYWMGVAAIYTLESDTSVTEDPLTLCGLRTAAQSGISYIDMINNLLSVHCEKNGKPRIELSELPSRAAVLLALYAGRIDFALSDTAAAADLKAKAPKPVRMVANRFLPRSYTGFAVRKDDTALAAALQAGLKAIYENGTYDLIAKKWQLEPLKLEAPGINLATAQPFDNPKP
ncbi:transporter substrate-binding domain-containing protein [Zavarzinia sp.]|uniref:transporter substrate-binding domain-containing protein n=1 Tax=Zavarzinia sp. TaxID=2027920 RepID=UPI00356B1E2A